MTSHGADDALALLIAEGRSRATVAGNRHLELYAAMAAATEGGRRFRPLLLTSVHDALHGRHADAAARIGAAVELLHTAFVIHDDVIDGDDVRRGRPNVSGTFASRARATGADDADAEALGRTAAILAGDLALAAALRAVATSDLAPDVVRNLLDLFDSALHPTAAGELADVALPMQAGEISLAESLLMGEQKTSGYSFVLPMQAGAVLAAADDDTVGRLGEAGLLLGSAFQLVDDLMGVFGDPSATGKSTTNDLRARKQTPLLVHARSTAAWHDVAGYLGRDLSNEELGEVRELLTASGSRQYVTRLAQARLDDACSVVETLTTSPDAVDDLVATMTACVPLLHGARGAAA